MMTKRVIDTDIGTAKKIGVAAVRNTLTETETGTEKARIITLVIARTAAIPVTPVTEAIGITTTDIIRGLTVTSVVSRTSTKLENVDDTMQKTRNIHTTITTVHVTKA